MVTVVAVSVCVCLCVCLSIKRHLTSGASVRPENAVTYSADNKGQKFVSFSLEMFQCRDQVIPPLMAIHQVGHFSYREHACALWIRKSDKDGTCCDASYVITLSSPGVLALR